MFTIIPEIVSRLLFPICLTKQVLCSDINLIYFYRRDGDLAYTSNGHQLQHLLFLISLLQLQHGKRRQYLFLFRKITYKLVENPNVGFYIKTDFRQLVVIWLMFLIHESNLHNITISFLSHICTKKFCSAFIRHIRYSKVVRLTHQVSTLMDNYKNSWMLF